MSPEQEGAGVDRPGGGPEGLGRPSGGPEGMPEAAQVRLAESDRVGSWTSDLSSAELVAVRGVGFEPAGLVLGSSIYHLGSQWGALGFGVWGRSGYYRSYPCPHGYSYMVEGHEWGQNWEHTQYERGMEEAFGLALSRLVSEAQAIHAHGVVGVRVTLRAVQGMSQVVEVTVLGTAVRRPGVPPLAVPFTSHLSGQDFAKLISTGWIAAGLVMGVAAVEADDGCGTRQILNSWNNWEVEQYSDAVERCREIAVHRLEEAAGHLGEGVVGVEADLSIREAGGREAKVADMRAIGTAVRQFRRASMPDPPLTIMRLTDR